MTAIGDEADLEHATEGPQPTGVGIGTRLHGSLSRIRFIGRFVGLTLPVRPTKGSVSRTLLRNVLTTAGDCKAIADSQAWPGTLRVIIPGQNGVAGFDGVAAELWPQTGPWEQK